MSSRLSTESRDHSLALLLALKEMSKCLRVKQMIVPVRGAPGAPYKGKPRAQVRADVGAGVASTVATTGPLTASVTAAWCIPSIHSCALLPIPLRSAAWRLATQTKWPRPIEQVARCLPRDCRDRT